MHITISEENKVLLEELKNEAILIKQEATELSISILIQLKTIMFQFLLSYKEYSLTNIREYGLTEILMSRAMRFFKLDQGEKKPKEVRRKAKFKFRLKLMSHQNVNTRSKKYSKAIKRKGYKYLVRKAFKTLLFPFYIVFLIFRILFLSKIKKRTDNNSKNSYKE